MFAYLTPTFFYGTWLHWTWVKFHEPKAVIRRPKTPVVFLNIFVLEAVESERT